MPTQKVQFYSGKVPGLSDRVSADGLGPEYADQVMVDLTTYYALMRYALATVSLTLGEVDYIIQSRHEQQTGLAEAQCLPDAIRALARTAEPKGDVDPQSLIDKLNSYSLTQRLAICDALGMYYAMDGEGTIGQLAQVGLLREEP